MQKKDGRNLFSSFVENMGNILQVLAGCLFDIHLNMPN